MLNNLFASTNSTVGNRGLTGTAQLTTLATEIANDIIRTMNEDADTYRQDIIDSQKDNNAMDNLIDRLYALDTADVDFLKELDERTLDGMLKSQQSKRSRCKSKQMTMDNYRALMTGAVAENLIRLATGKEKNAGGPRRAAGIVDYTIEQLQQLEMDQEKLRKEIRNIQSKKSIMKSKADFSEDDERYQSLLKAERQLKDMRVGAMADIIEVDTTKMMLKALFDEIEDIHMMDPVDAKELLVKIYENYDVESWNGKLSE